MKTFVLVLMLLHVSHHASVVVEVDEGGSAVLPCKATSSLSDQTVVEWRRNAPLLTVHIRQNDRDQPSNQYTVYSRRTAMRTDAQKTRDLSLTLSNAMIFDKGVYVCSVSDGNNQYEQKVELHVNIKDDVIDKRLAELWNGIIVLGVLFGVTVVGTVGYLVYKKYTEG